MHTTFVDVAHTEALLQRTHGDSEAVQVQVADLGLGKGTEQPMQLLTLPSLWKEPSP